MPSTARDWMLTISAEKHTQQAVEELLDVLGAYIFQQEEGGETGYPHFQAFLQLQSPIHMKTLKNKFKKAGFNDAQVVPEKLRTLDRGRPWRDSQFASTRLSPSRDMSR